MAAIETGILIQFMHLLCKFFWIPSFEPGFFIPLIQNCSFDAQLTINCISCKESCFPS